MIIVENSSIVNWDNYPECVCAVVMQTTRDLKTDDGLICPKGEELIWLLDKAPEIINGSMRVVGANIDCLGGLGISGKKVDCLDVLELHFKPKPVVKTESKQECYA